MSTINTYSDIDRRDTLTAKFEEIDNTIYVEEVSLTAANIIAMNATPVELVAAPGAGYVLEFVSATFIFDYGTTQFTGGGTIVIQQGTTGNDWTATVPATAVTSAVDAIFVMPVLSAASIESDPAENDSIVITNATAAFAAGDGVARVKVAYRKHATGL